MYMYTTWYIFVCVLIVRMFLVQTLAVVYALIMKWCMGEMPSYWNWLQFAVYDGIWTVSKPTGEEMKVDMWLLKVVSHGCVYTHRVHGEL